jgi:hypothetical protein
MIDTEDELRKLNFADQSSRLQVKLILSIFDQTKASSVALSLYRRTAQSLYEDWEYDRLNCGGRRSRSRDYGFQASFADRIAAFALKQEKEDALFVYSPIIDAVENPPRALSRFIEGLIYSEDGREDETSFWEIWQAFADRIASAEWVLQLDENYTSSIYGQDLVRVVFLGISWKDGVRYWSRLRDQEHRLNTLARRLPSSPAVLRSYCRFLYHIGESALPESFDVIAERLRAGDTPRLLSEKNVLFYLESTLQRYVYSEPLRLKADPALRKAVLYILDEMVEAGSSAAYQMRDDFVTPISPSFTSQSQG